MFSEDTTIENRMDVGNLRRTHICLLKRGCFSDLGLSMKVKSVTYLVDKKTVLHLFVVSCVIMFILTKTLINESKFAT